MSAHDEKEPWRKRPVNKATMDEPQEEFIEANASTLETEEDYRIALAHVSHWDRWAGNTETAG